MKQDVACVDKGPPRKAASMGKLDSPTSQVHASQPGLPSVPVHLQQLFLEDWPAPSSTGSEAQDIHFLSGVSKGVIVTNPSHFFLLRV